MKKMYPVLVFCFFISIVAKSQFDVGQKVLGGSLGFSTYKNETNPPFGSATKGTGVFISPTFSKFTKPNVLRGVGLVYQYSFQRSGDSTNASSNSSHSFGLNFFSQHFFTLATNFFFTLNTTAGVEYHIGKQSVFSGNLLYNYNINGFGIFGSLAPGLTYRVTPRLLIDTYINNLISINYSHLLTKNSSQSPTPAEKAYQNSFTLSSSLSSTNIGNIGLGFRWMLKK